MNSVNGKVGANKISVPVIKTDNLTKRYAGSSSVLALDGLNLEVDQGEIFGYLGPNGAGKTTTIRILMDLIRPTSGKATLLGMDARENSVEIHKRIGFLPGELNLWQNEKAINVIRYFARIRGGVNKKYAQELADRLQFDVNKRLRDYSTGNKRKLGLILALMHQPELLILDEPTSGLDPLMQQIFIDLMREWRDAGRTVFLSSHMLTEVQSICDRVAILRGGKLQAIETVTRLTHVDFKRITIEFREPAQTGNLANLPGISELESSGNILNLRLSGDFDPLLRAIQSQYVVSLKVAEPTLEEIFLTFYGGNNHHTNATEISTAKNASVVKERA
ncbi:MAG TPA: ABC transporter ATP-binding protein [Phototrophicaceae bacterium]|nr:ABC transporter ATP-binding protein [Phototrophicaceae bacterium]